MESLSINALGSTIWKQVGRPPASLRAVPNGLGLRLEVRISGAMCVSKYYLVLT
jgi:hypothetical protein